jgi:hypothetical protein
VKGLTLAVVALAVTGCGQARRCSSPANPYGATPANWTYAKADAGQREWVMKRFRLHRMEKYGQVDVTMAYHAESPDGVLVSLKGLRADDMETLLHAFEEIRLQGHVKMLRHWVGDTNTRVILAADGSETTIAPKGCTLVLAAGIDRYSAAALSQAVFG